MESLFHLKHAPELPFLFWKFDVECSECLASSLVGHGSELPATESLAYGFHDQ